MSDKHYILFLSQRELNQLYNCLDEYKLNVRGTIMVDDAIEAIEIVNEAQDIPPGVLEVTKAIMKKAEVSLFPLTGEEGERTWRVIEKPVNLLEVTHGEKSRGKFNSSKGRRRRAYMAYKEALTKEGESNGSS